MENVVTHENDVAVFDRRESKERLLFNFQGPSGQVGHINAEGPPVPIPNTEVKLCSADSTMLATAWEGRSWPTPHPCITDARPDEGETPWGCSSAGRAPALQAGGHGFESHHLHQAKPKGFAAGKAYRLCLIKCRDSKNERNRATIRWIVVTASDQGAQFAPRPDPIISPASCRRQ